jgi:TonB family protein
MLTERHILLLFDPAPRRPVILFSFFSHLVALVLVVIVWRNTAKVHIVHVEYKIVQTISGQKPVAYNSAETKPRQSPSLLHLRKSTRPARAVETESMTHGISLQGLRERAKQATAGLMTDIKQRQLYGFSTSDYKLAIRTAGEIPPIPADDLPPRFEQYVMVDITIDVDGRVAEAQIVGGLVPPKIQQTLLSAIREFKYSPATRNGTPIPSQLEIVVHVPS